MRYRREQLVHGNVQAYWKDRPGAGNKTGVNSIFNKKKWFPLATATDFMISHKCCNVMKKSPLHIYQTATRRYPYLGTLAEESRLRTQAWIRKGCNAFDGSAITSQPMSFWLEQDVLHYILDRKIEICSVYGDIVEKEGKLQCSGCPRTGCIFCAFGAHLDKGETRFQKLAVTHPKQYEYCMRGGQYADNPNYDPFAPEMDGDWKNWNPKKIWVPSKEGLGMKHVFDEMNQIYGKDFIRYE